MIHSVLQHKPQIKAADLRSCSGDACQETDRRDVWTARRFIAAQPRAVLALLTDPDLITLWAPIDFEVDGLRGRRLRGGTRTIVNGSLAGITAEFEIHVVRADAAGLELHARGLVDLEVAYRFFPERHGVTVDAEVKLGRESGLRARVLRAATMALLAAGALKHALDSIAKELDECAA